MTDTETTPVSDSPAHRKNPLVELAGWYGTFAVVGAYLLVSFQAISSKGDIYQLLNLTGALGVLLISWRKRAVQPAVLNMVWSVIAIIALLH